MILFLEYVKKSKISYRQFLVNNWKIINKYRKTSYATDPNVEK